jgi:serine/threonine protein kinase
MVIHRDLKLENVLLKSGCCRAGWRQLRSAGLRRRNTQPAALTLHTHTHTQTLCLSLSHTHTHRRCVSPTHTHAGAEKVDGQFEVKLADFGLSRTVQVKQQAVLNLHKAHSTILSARSSTTATTRDSDKMPSMWVCCCWLVAEP